MDTIYTRLGRAIGSPFLFALPLRNPYSYLTFLPIHAKIESEWGSYALPHPSTHKYKRSVDMMSLGMRYDNEAYCETCDKPLKRCVDTYEYWGSKFSQSYYECTNDKCPECEDYDGSDDYLEEEEQEG